jgi:aminopeptidase-like protein
MRSADPRESPGALDTDQSRAARMRTLMERLYPLCRSITGDGVRRTLDVLSESLPLERRSVPSGTAVHDWVVNDEWNVRDAWIAGPDGRRVVDFSAHNLHLVGYSVPVRATMTLSELRPHLHTLPEHPDWIPYRTTYYDRTWGFCLTQRQLDAMDEGPWEVVVDTTLEPGELTYGELVLPGDTEDEVLVSSHVCHPSLANDNLSGTAVACELAMALAARERRRYTYRFLFAPGTIGSITWLARNPDRIARVRHGLVLTGLGGPGQLVYKRTRHGDRLVDRAASHVVLRRGGEVRDYSPYGYDERQYNSLGFDLAVGRLSRTPHGEYPEYHTSADDLDFVKDAELLASFEAVTAIVDVLEGDSVHVNLSPHGEPQLGRRGLYPTVGGRSASDAVMAMLWLLAYSDGHHSTLDVAERGGLGFDVVQEAARRLVSGGLLSQAGSSVDHGRPDA